MPKYTYLAKDKEAHSFSGTIESRDSSSAVLELKKRGLIVISVAEEKEAHKAKAGDKFKGKKIKTAEIVVFCRQLATLVSSGVSLLTCLNIIYDQIESVYLKQIVLDLKKDIEAGSSLFNAFSKYRGVFPGIFINMVKAGEASGSLGEILDRVAVYLEKSEKTARKIKAAMTYPAIVIFMSLAILVFLILKVVPTFKSMFESLKGELPLPTKLLIAISDQGLRFFPFILVGAVLAWIIFIKYINSDKGRLNFDRFKLKAPMFGTLFEKVVMSRFASTLAILLKSGVNILEAFDIVGEVLGNRVIQGAVQQTKISLSSGTNIAKPMEETNRFPPFVYKMIAIGEQTGELEKMLSKVSEYYESQVDEAIAGLSSMIEPLIISFLGTTVGFIVVSMFLPIFKMTQMVQGG